MNTLSSMNSLGNLSDIDSSYLFPQIDRIIDPVVDSTYKDIWMATAKVRKSF